MDRGQGAGRGSHPRRRFPVRGGETLGGFPEGRAGDERELAKDATAPLALQLLPNSGFEELARADRPKGWLVRHYSGEAQHRVVSAGAAATRSALLDRRRRHELLRRGAARSRCHVPAERLDSHRRLRREPLLRRVPECARNPGLGERAHAGGERHERLEVGRSRVRGRRPHGSDDQLPVRWLGLGEGQGVVRRREGRARLESRPARARGPHRVARHAPLRAPRRVRRCRRCAACARRRAGAARDRDSRCCCRRLAERACAEAYGRRRRPTDACGDATRAAAARAVRGELRARAWSLATEFAGLRDTVVAGARADLRGRRSAVGGACSCGASVVGLVPPNVRSRRCCPVSISNPRAILRALCSKRSGNGVRKSSASASSPQLGRLAPAVQRTAARALRSRVTWTLAHCSARSRPATSRPRSSSPRRGKSSRSILTRACARFVERVRRKGQPAVAVDIAAFSRELAALRGDPVRGREVFRQNCATCHSVGGEGGPARSGARRHRLTPARRGADLDPRSQPQRRGELPALGGAHVRRAHRRRPSYGRDAHRTRACRFLRQEPGAATRRDRIDRGLSVVADAGGF